MLLDFCLFIVSASCVNILFLFLCVHLDSQWIWLVVAFGFLCVFVFTYLPT